MKANKKIEKLFVEAEIKFDSQANKEAYYSRETNTFEFYDLQSLKQTLECSITNILMCEFYLEYVYKYFKEYFRINNELNILGSTKDDPQLLVCLEFIKDLILRAKNIKTKLIEYHIETSCNVVYKPIVNSNASMMFALSWQNELKIPKTAQDMFEIVIEAIQRCELCIETFDYLINSFFFLKTEDDLISKNDKIDDSKEYIGIFLDYYLDFKMNHLIKINI